MVKYKIRPQTSYARRFEKRIQKSLKLALEDTDNASSCEEITITKPKSRPQTSKRKLRLVSSKSEEGSDRFTDFPLNTFENLRDLEGFWLILNNVELDCVRLKEQKGLLFEENKHLRGMMRSILEAAALDKSGIGTGIPTRVCSRYKRTKSAPLQRCKA